MKALLDVWGGLLVIFGVLTVMCLVAVGHEPAHNPPPAPVIVRVDATDGPVNWQSAKREHAAGRLVVIMPDGSMQTQDWPPTRPPRKVGKR